MSEPKSHEHNFHRINIKEKLKMLKICLTTLLLSAATLTMAQNRGVTDTEIVLGLITDLSVLSH